MFGWAVSRDEKAEIFPISKHLVGDLPRQLLSAVQIGFAALLRLPGWQRQTLHQKSLRSSTIVGLWLSLSFTSSALPGPVSVSRKRAGGS
jgi:hypothetical protein